MKLTLEQLNSDLEDARVRKKWRAIWHRRPAKPDPARGKFVEYHLYEVSGWFVQHCGHATALWPFVFFNAQGERFLAPHGKGFRRAEDAKRACFVAFCEARGLKI